MKRLIIGTALSVMLLLCPVLTAQDMHTGFEEVVQRIQPLEKAEWKIVTEEPDDSLQFIRADNDAFLYTGRIDFSDKTAPVLIWEGSTVRFNFTGECLGLRFKPSGSNSAYYNVLLDGEIYLLHLEGTYETDYILQKKLGSGLHTCEVFKRNEAQSDTDTFLGADIAAGGRMGAKPAERPLLIEFYGDSITAGACDETPGKDNYVDMVQHNCYTSYAAITCRALNADLSDISVGGTGMCVSWNDVIMAKCWKNLYCSPSSVLYDFGGRTPDIVVVNLGQNDFGWTQNEHLPFPAGFESAYLELLREIRAQYPDAWIISATGGMSAVMQSRQLNAGIAHAVKAMNEPEVVSMKFRAYTYDHPRADTHEKMAEELETFIKANVTLPGRLW
jgi:lysophospholipase L1-like esterase